MNIQWIGSPNFDKNRKTVDRIVIHWMAGTLDSTDKVFQDTKRGTSAHYGIEDGKIHQYVNTDHVAYHAGNYAMNQRSIGIEHSAAPDRLASEETYQTSGKLIASLVKKYPFITLDRNHIIKHSEVPHPTQCCGTVDVDKLIAIAKLNLDTQPTGGIAVNDPDFKTTFLNIAKALFNDNYDEAWNANQKRVWLENEAKRLVDQYTNYKKIAENPPVTVGDAPRDFVGLFTLAAQIAKAKGL